LDVEYKTVIKSLQADYAKFNSIVELAFNFDVNIAFAGSIELAYNIGVTESKILKNKKDIDNYFLN
jgi:hypothetical protein